jgi:membrane-bound inhibitor of C-type lysozyme
MKALIKFAMLAIPIAFAIAPLSTNAQTETTQPSKVVAFRCSQGKAFKVQYNDQTAVVIVNQKTPITLVRTRSADGVRYAETNGGHVLFLKGNEAILQNNGQVVYQRCVVVTAATKPTTPTTPPSGQPVQALW